MAKKSTASSARGTRAKRNAKVIPDSQIDFSDIPEITDEQLSQMRPGRPLLGITKRELISIRIDPVVLEQLRRRAKKQGKGYQTLINEILGQYLKRGAA